MVSGTAMEPGQMQREQISTQERGGLIRSMAGESCNIHLGVFLKVSGHMTRNKGLAQCTGQQTWSGTEATGRVTPHTG